MFISETSVTIKAHVAVSGLLPEAMLISEHCGELAQPLTSHSGTAPLPLAWAARTAGSLTNLATTQA